jgi:uncharacterized membrane protein YcgQ (UPF0703/DUF1980 family)
MPPLRALQAFCWLAFLALVLLGGHATTYLVAWQTWLVFGAMLVLALGVAIGLLTRNDHHDHAHDHDAHDHEHPTWIETGVHALPLLLFVAMGPTSLGSHTLSESGQIDATRFVPTTPSERTIVDGYHHTDLLALRHDPFLDGGKIELIARLGELTEQTTRKHRNTPAPTPKPVLFRHLISCCAADGRPIYAWLKDPPTADLPLDAWVRVRGTVNVRETGGVIPVITAELIEVVPPPKQAYLILPGTVAAPGHVPVTPTAP